MQQVIQAKDYSEKHRLQASVLGNLALPDSLTPLFATRLTSQDVSTKERDYWLAMILEGRHIDAATLVTIRPELVASRHTKVDKQVFIGTALAGWYHRSRDETLRKELAAVLRQLKYTSSPQIRSLPMPIYEGDHLLIRKGKVVGGIRFDSLPFLEKDYGTNILSYSWWYRDDGTGTFGLTDPDCKHGTVKEGTSLEFGPFDVDWSSHCFASIYVSYPPPDLDGKVSEEAYQLCSRLFNDWGGVDAMAKDLAWRVSPELIDFSQSTDAP